MEITDEDIELATKEADERKIAFKQLQEEVKELKAKGGRARGLITKENFSAAEAISEAFTNGFAEIAPLIKQAKINHTLTLKDAGTMTAANNLTGGVVANYGSPEVRPRALLHFRDLVRIINSSTGLWKYYRQNAVVGEGSFGFQTTHGELKNQVDYDLTEVSITCDYLAGFCRIAKQMLQDLPFLQSFVSGELIEDYLRKEDNVFFGQLYSAATGTPGTSTVTVEKIIETIANLAENDFNVNGIVLTNPVWATLLKTKPNDYSIPGGVVITPAGDIVISGVPVYRTSERNLGANKMLIGDWTKAAIIQAEGLSISMSEHDDTNFVRNLVTCKAEARVAMGVMNPAAFVFTNAGTT